MNETVKTQYWGDVEIRYTNIEGRDIDWITLADNGTNETYASIRVDAKTQKIFAVLFDDNCNIIMKGDEK